MRGGYLRRCFLILRRSDHWCHASNTATKPKAARTIASPANSNPSNPSIVYSRHDTNGGATMGALCRNATLGRVWLASRPIFQTAPIARARTSPCCDFSQLPTGGFSTPKEAARAKLNWAGGLQGLTPRPFCVTVRTRCPDRLALTAGPGLVTAPQQGRKGATTSVLCRTRPTFA
jgi:hypothetical protein